MAIKPELLKDVKTTRTGLLELMKKEVNSSKGKTVTFFATKKYQLPKTGEKPMPLFIIAAEPKKFETVAAAQKMPMATGTCDIMEANGICKIYVKKSAGTLQPAGIATLVGEALGPKDFAGTTSDPTVEVTPEKPAAQTPKALTKEELAKKKEAADKEQAAHDKKVQEAQDQGKTLPKKSGAEMAKESHEKAGDMDWKPDQQALQAFMKACIQMTEFGKFKANFDDFMKKYGLSNDGKLPTDIWNKLFLGLMKTDYKFSNKDIEKAADGRFKLLVDGPTGTKIREKTLVKAMNGLKPFVDHAATYMDKLVAKGNSGTTWAFWSGTGAEDSAKQSGGVALEGTVGSFFAKYQGEWINWKALLGGDTSEFPLWTALSEMYAAKGAEYMAKYKFIGFVGPGATNDNNVFNSIEQPTFIEVLTVKTKVPPPHIEWYVVDCAFAEDPKGGAEHNGKKGWWNWTKKPNEKFDNRQKALDRIKERYGK